MFEKKCRIYIGEVIGVQNCTLSLYLMELMNIWYTTSTKLFSIKCFEFFISHNEVKIFRGVHEFDSNYVDMGFV